MFEAYIWGKYLVYILIEVLNNKKKNYRLGLSFRITFILTYCCYYDLKILIIPILLENKKLYSSFIISNSCAFFVSIDSFSYMEVIVTWNTKFNPKLTFRMCWNGAVYIFEYRVFFFNYLFLKGLSPIEGQLMIKYRVLYDMCMPLLRIHQLVQMNDDIVSV